MNKFTKEEIYQIFGELISAISSISHGGTSGPTGLEGLAMSIAGKGLEKNLGNSIEILADAIYNGLGEIASSIDRLADTIDSSNKEKE